MPVTLEGYEWGGRIDWPPIIPEGYRECEREEATHYTVPEGRRWATVALAPCRDDCIYIRLLTMEEAGDDARRDPKQIYGKEIAFAAGFNEGWRIAKEQEELR